MSATINQTKLMEVAEMLVNDLPERSRDIVSRRFGIGSSARETLEGIGKSYGITRERVRQIESEALNRLRAVGQDSRELNMFFSDLATFIKAHGGVMQEDILLNRYLDRCSASYNDCAGFIMLLLSLGDEFRRGKESDVLHPHWYTDRESVDLAKSLVKALKKKLEKENRVLSQDELHDLALMEAPVNDVDKDAVFAYIDTSKVIGYNTYGEYGLVWWAEVQPRGVRDKAYLVLKKNDAPLHFREITDSINKANFSPRQAKPQTVHNELIKDKRFVLVGRGIYALSEWGYAPGTVKDVLVDIMSKKSEPMTESQIIDAVMKQRMVKPETIRFNLKSSSDFERVGKDSYKLAK